MTAVDDDDSSGVAVLVEVPDVEIIDAGIDWKPPPLARFEAVGEDRASL